MSIQVQNICRSVQAYVLEPSHCYLSSPPRPTRGHGRPAPARAWPTRSGVVCLPRRRTCLVPGLSYPLSFPGAHRSASRVDRQQRWARGVGSIMSQVARRPMMSGRTGHDRSRGERGRGRGDRGVPCRTLRPGCFSTIGGLVKHGI